MTKKEFRAEFSLYVRGHMTREQEYNFELVLWNNKSYLCIAISLIKRYEKVGVLRYANKSVVATRLPLGEGEKNQIKRIQNLRLLPPEKLSTEIGVVKKPIFSFLESTHIPTQTRFGMAAVKTLVIIVIISFILYLFFL